MRISDWSADVCSSDLPQGVQTLSRLGRCCLQCRGQPVGGVGARQQVIDRNAMSRNTAARHPGHETGQSATGTIGQAQYIDWRLYRAGGNVDNAAETAL